MSPVTTWVTLIKVLGKPLHHDWIRTSIPLALLSFYLWSFLNLAGVTLW